MFTQSSDLRQKGYCTTTKKTCLLKLSLVNWASRWKISLTMLVRIKPYAMNLWGISEVAPQRPMFESPGSVPSHKMPYDA